jgi:hypothetical protein
VHGHYGQAGLATAHNALLCRRRPR